MSALSRLWSLRDDGPRFVLLGSLALASLLAWPLVDSWWLQEAGISGTFRFFDFGAYYAAAVDWLEADSIYDRGPKGGYHGSFLYPPFMVAFFRQFALLKFRAAAMAFQGFSVGLLWIGLQLVVGSLGYRLRWYERLGLLWAAVGFQPVWLSMKMGQTAALMAALLCFAFVGMDRGERRDDRRLQWLGGAFTAAVGLVKLAYAPVGAHLLRNRDRFAGAVAGGGLLLAFSIAVFGVELHLTYLDVLMWGFERGGQARTPALWLPPYFRPLQPLGPMAEALVAVGLWPANWPSPLHLLRFGASAAVALVAVLAAPGRDREVFALGVAAFPLLAPLTYTYYLAALLPAALVLLATELERDGAPEVVAAGLLLAHLHSFGLKFVVDVLPTWLPVFAELRPLYGLFQPGLWGAGLLAALALARAAESIPQGRLDALFERVKRVGETGRARGE